MLALEDISVRYANGAIGVEQVSLELEAGRVVALFGANGAGKTSTVRAATGFIASERAQVETGRVVVDGKDLTNREPHVFVAAGVAAIPERRKVFPSLTVRDNLRSTGVRRDAGYAARFDQVLELFPVLGLRLDAAAGQLSGGEQQMLAIARGVILGARYLVIDEMTLGLHSSLRRPLFEVVSELASYGTGVLIVDENVEESLEVAEHCYLLRNGVIEREGTPRELRAGLSMPGGPGGL